MHEITQDDSGARHGTDGTITMSLLDADGRMFKRRAVKVGAAEAHENWLVAELDGVRVYQSGNHVVVTRQDINP